MDPRRQEGEEEAAAALASGIRPQCTARSSISLTSAPATAAPPRPAGLHRDLSFSIKSDFAQAKSVNYIQ
uniref:Uncharacterized protein n=1 Tax=Sphaerodactylus townsendi TaxID=933632 RepID=A0ACB8G9K1_9SAUR